MVQDTINLTLRVRQTDRQTDKSITHCSFLSSLTQQRKIGGGHFLYMSRPPPPPVWVCLYVWGGEAYTTQNPALSSLLGGAVDHQFKDCWWLWEMIPHCKCFPFISPFALFASKDMLHLLSVEQIGTHRTDRAPRWIKCNSCLYCSAPLLLCSFFILVHIIYITIMSSVALFFPHWGCALWAFWWI